MIIHVEAADELIKNTAQILHFPTQNIPVFDAVGCRIAENIYADRDYPPFARVMMDGVAMGEEDFLLGKLKIIGQQFAGEKPLILTQKGTCVKIATGAVLPIGADFILPKERYRIEYEGNEKFILYAIDFSTGNKSIHEKGRDAKAGDLLIEKNTSLTPAHIGILASVGKAQIDVYTMPKIHILGTGDELVEVNETPENHQIRHSNSYAIAAAIQSKMSKIPISISKSIDNEEILTQKILSLAQHEVIISSGAVSVGDMDLVPKVLEKLGYEIIFHTVSQRPGKPFLFARKENQVYFGLPGNPLSALIGTYRYIIPFLEEICGLKRPVFDVSLAHEVTFLPNLTYFLPVKINHGQAEAIFSNNSGDMLSVARADGFVELKREFTLFEAGTKVRFFSF